MGNQWLCVGPTVFTEYNSKLEMSLKENKLQVNLNLTDESTKVWEAKVLFTTTGLGVLLSDIFYLKAGLLGIKRH